MLITLVWVFSTNVMTNVIWLEIRAYNINNITLLKVWKKYKIYYYYKYSTDSESNVMCYEGSRF